MGRATLGRRGLVALLVASALLVGLGGFVIGWQAVAAPERFDAAEARGSAPASLAPSMSRPWADRPTIRLSYRVASDHESATGTEHVSFTPDQKVCDHLVFRAWPNKPELAEHGASLRVRDAVVAGERVQPRVERHGAPKGSPGSLVKLPLRWCVLAGETVKVRLGFTVEMARASGDRVGANGSGEMWFASAYPVLAWERGHGWMTEPAVELYGEMDGAEEFRLSLDVVAPKEDAVLGTGRALGTSEGPRPGTTRHRFAADSVRNVAVSVGGYRVTERKISGVHARLGISDDGAKASADVWLDKVATELNRLERRFGRLPYRDLWITVIPDTTGIEFPGAIFYGDQAPRQVIEGDVVTHELAHMWFYGLVGNDQGRDPWLDEAFATYAQALADGQQRHYRDDTSLPGTARYRVGEPMTYWAAHRSLYGPGVYEQGATMLFEARRKAGAARWDAAVQDYLGRHGHRIVRPEDFVAAVDHLPGAVATLKRYGAVE